MIFICDDIHECSSCHKPTTCNTYRWACPWKNDDEDMMCMDCMEEEEIRQYEHEAELLKVSKEK